MKQRILFFLAALIFSASQSLWAYTIEIDPMMITSTGTISVDKTSCESGVTVTVTPSPADGYAIGYVKYMGEDYQDIATIEPVDGVYSFTMPDKNVIVSAYFKKLLTNADITIDPIADQTYTGSALVPAVTVRDYEEPINDRCDISYSNNINAGTATVTIKPKEGESYAGEVTTTFKIAPQGVTLTANSRDTDVYDGTVKTVTGFTCSVEGLTFDGVSASGSGTEAGDYDVTFSGVTLNETKDTSGNYVVTETVNGKLTIAPPPTYTLTGLAFAEGMHYATYCNTTDKDLTLPKGLKAYVVSGKNAGVVTLVGVEFLPKPKGTTYFPLLLYREDVNAIVGTALEYKGDASAPTFNYMRYALTEKSVSGSEFVLYDDDFVRATGTIPAGKCYLDLDDAAPQTVGIGAEAGGVRIAINGTVTNAYSDDFGKVSYTISGTTCTLTVTPSDGNYYKASELTVTKTVDGSQAATRGKSTNPGYNVAVEVTPSEANQNLASETTYTFEVEEPYGYDVTVVFDARMSIDDATVTLEETNYTFDNQAHQPGVTVKLGDTELTADKDYLVSYPADCTSTGEKTITISGRSVYCGTVTAKYTIEEATPATTLVSDKLTLNSTSQFYYDYNGQTISVSYDGTKLTAEDYDISIKTYDGNVVSQCVDLGSYIAVITGKGKYTGTVEKVFLINPKSFMGSNILITLDKTVFIHNGITQEPTVTVKDGEKTLEEDKDYHIGYSLQINTANGLEYISCFSPCEVGKYTVNITGIGNYSGEISRPFEITSGAVAEPNATADGVTITGPSDEMRARIESAHKAGKKLEIQIPSSVDGQPVTRIADNAFADAQENVTLVFKNFDPSITFGENSTGGANLETTPEELGNLAKQPNLLETLKKGKIFAWLESFPLRSFSSSTNIKIKAEAEYKTTLYAIVDSVCKNQMTNGIVKAALGQDRELNVHIDTKDFLQAFKCNVKENTLSKQYEVSMASLNSTMYSAADKSYVYTANNGILVACDTTGIMTFADGYVDEFVESLNLDAAAQTAIAPYVKTIKNKIKNTIRKHGAKLEAKFNEQTAATGDAQTYAPNMLVPVVEAWSYKNDSQFTYFALTTRNKKNEFVKIADSDTKTPAGKALLKVPTSMVTVSAARSFAISGIEDQDEATAIGAIDRDERATGNDFWYSVSGQRIDQPTAPGIYIRNGKKVIVK